MDGLKDQNMDIGLMVVAFVIVLGPLVFLHELGHFLVAKLTGVHIEEFGFGYPPRLLKFWQSPGRLDVGNAQVVIQHNFKLPPQLQVGRSVDAIVSHDERGQNVLRRMVLLEPKQEAETATGAASQVASDEMHLRGQVTRLDRGTEYTLNLIPLGGFVRPRGENDPQIAGGLASAPKRVRFAILAAGATMNLLAAVVILSLIFATGSPEVARANVTIVEVSPDSPAAQAGLQVNDVVVKAGGQSIQRAEDLTGYVRSHTDQPIVLTVQRGDQTLEFRLIPRSNPPENQGPTGIRIDERPVEITTVRYPLPQAIVRGLSETGRQIGFVASVPVRVIRGLIPAPLARPVGPVGISQLAGESLRLSLANNQWYPLLYLTASISIALAITNLLPLPALDGGRILFVLIEAVRGRRVDPERETAIHFIGMALLLALMLLITWQDLVNPVVIPR